MIENDIVHVTQLRLYLYNNGPHTVCYRGAVAVSAEGLVWQDSGVLVQSQHGDFVSDEKLDLIGEI